MRETREERIERLETKHEAKAERAGAEAQRRFRYADTMLDVMNGQPILVGHHSEKRHRRDIGRVDTAIHKGVEAARARDHHLDLAASAQRTGIGVQDLDATEQLKVKLADLEEERENVKALNSAFRKAGGVKSLENALRKMFERADELGCCQLAKRGAGTLRICDYEKVPFPPYHLQNLGANIRRVKARIAEVAAVAQIPDDAVVAEGTCEGKNFRFVTDTDDGRLRFESPRLSRDACQILRRYGFKWSRTRNAWIRLLNQGAIGVARDIVTPQLERLVA